MSISVKLEQEPYDRLRLIRGAGRMYLEGRVGGDDATVDGEREEAGERVGVRAKNDDGMIQISTKCGPGVPNAKWNKPKETPVAPNIRLAFTL